jgi:hypothetical protein
MSLRLQRLLPVLFALPLLLVVGCGDEDAPTLSSEHPGWSQPSCNTAGCHRASGHTDQSSRRCGNCHGANGACVPPANHTASDSCTGCHQSQHGFAQGAAFCVSCHFAEKGTEQCTAPAADSGGGG